MDRQEPSYYLPTKIIFERGCISRINEVIKSFGVRKLLLVTGKSAMRKSGVTVKISSHLKNYDITIFDEVSPNPDTDTIDKGASLARKNKSELIIALGGGSVLDAAKVISVLTRSRISCEKQLLNKGAQIKQGLPLIAIPTTAGSGSEVTKYAVITTHSLKTKVALGDDFLYPKWALVDPELTMSMSASLTTASGLDALCHAIESFWSKKANPISDYFALNASKLIFKNISAARIELKNFKIRRQMSLGSLFAGMAIAQTGTTAPHSISYPLTYYFGLDHGLACAIILPAIMKYNLKVVKGKLDCLAKALGFKNTLGLIKAMNKLLLKIDVVSFLRDANIQKKDLTLILKKSFSANIKNNPRPITKKALTKILEDSLF